MHCYNETIKKAYEEYFYHFLRTQNSTFSSVNKSFSLIIRLLNENAQVNCWKSTKQNWKNCNFSPVSMTLSKEVMGLHFIDKTFHRQRRFFIDKGKYKDEKKREKRISFVKNISSVYEKSSLSMKCPIYEISYLWNVQSMKCLIYKMSYSWYCYLWNVFYEMSFYDFFSFNSNFLE